MLRHAALQSFSNDIPTVAHDKRPDRLKAVVTQHNRKHEIELHWHVALVIKRCFQFAEPYGLLSFTTARCWPQNTEESAVLTK